MTVAVVSAGCHFGPKWQPAAIGATFCSKVVAIAVGCHFGSKWPPALSVSTSAADLSLCRGLALPVCVEVWLWYCNSTGMTVYINGAVTGVVSCGGSGYILYYV